MSYSALIAASKISEREPRIQQRELTAPQARLVTQPSVGGYGKYDDLFDKRLFKSTLIGENWSKPDPTTNPTNDLAHALRLNFIARPHIYNQPRIVGNNKAHLQTLRMKNTSQRPPDRHLTELDPSLIFANAAPLPPKHVAYSTAM